MEQALRVLNELEHNGVLGRYAIGGAMAATFYVEPLLTFDLDIFVVLASQGGLLVSLTPLYEALRERGYPAEAEFVPIAGVPVQFLPAYNPLVEEALAAARDVLYAQTPTRVLTAEHLVAISIQTGREKDRQRVRVFLEQCDLDRPALDAILGRHGLQERWLQWTR
jgi:hypothetical protein